MAVKGRMQWLRLHSDARTDAKLESLPDDEFRVWFRLLCFANEQPERGVFVDYSPRLLAVEVAHGDVALLTRTLASLVDLRILVCDEGADVTTFIHWLERQYDKESDWPENTRSRKAEQRSRDVTPSHAQSRDVTQGHAPYKERETETETEVISDEGRSGVSMAPVASAAPTLGALALSPTPPVGNIVPLKPVPIPKPVAIQPAIKQPAMKSARPPDLLWDACVASCGGVAPSNKVERGKWNKGVAALRESGATADEIAIRAERYRRRYGERIALNPMALAGNWTVLATEVTDDEQHNTSHTSGKQYSGSSRPNDQRRGGSSHARGAYNPQLPTAEDFQRWARERRAAGATNIIGG